MDMGGAYDSRGNLFAKIRGEGMKKKVTFVFHVNDVRVEKTVEYDEEIISRDKIVGDIKEWFFREHYMWFAVKTEGEETNLEDF